ncbi:hypothetical protein D3C86_1911060 [compost metagenome]
MRAWAWRSSGEVAASSWTSRSMDSVGSISRRRRSSASVRKIAQTSSGAEKYSRRSPGWWESFTRLQDSSSLRPILTLEREKPSDSAISSAFRGREAVKSRA